MSFDPVKGYDYSTLVSNPVDGIPPGTILPLSMIPDDLRCPWCLDEKDSKAFKNENGLRGHAHGKHGIRWEKPEPVAPPAGYPDYSLMVMPKDRETLKPWHMIGIAMHDLYGLTWEEVGDRMGRGHTMLSQVGLSPAGKAFRQRLRDMTQTPEAIALMLMKANSLNVTFDYMQALEWAKEARDYAAVGRMTKDLLSLAGAEEKQVEEDQGKELHYHIHLDGNSLEAPFVTSTHQLLDAEVVDE